MGESVAIALEAFCGEGGSRHAFTKPFVRGGWRNATDGRILVRVPSNEPDTEGKWPKMGELFLRKWNRINAVALVVPGRGTEECRDCYGTRFIHIECCDCEGSGSCECNDCGDRHKCAACRGRGVVRTGRDCRVCQGTGKEYQDVKIGWLNCTGRHIARIAQNLPNPRAVEISSGAVRFEFDGGEGLLRGIANEDEGP